MGLINIFNNIRNLVFQKKFKMGKGFGNLAYVRNQITFTLSPFEQKPFAKFFKAGIPNTVRRTLEEMPFILPPLLSAYALYSWTVNESHRLHRKASGVAH